MSCLRRKTEIDFRLESETDDYPEPEKGIAFYEYYYALWEMRFGYQEDRSKSFEENLRLYIKFNHKKQQLNKILNIHIDYFISTGKGLV